MENELRNEINRLREELRVARTVHIACYYPTPAAEWPLYRDNGELAIFANAADAELFAAKHARHPCKVRTIEVK